MESALRFVFMKKLFWEISVKQILVRKNHTPSPHAVCFTPNIGNIVTNNSQHMRHTEQVSVMTSEDQLVSFIMDKVET